MAPRKDMMRVLRQDNGYSARLGFGAALMHGAEGPGRDGDEALRAKPTPAPPREGTSPPAATASRIAGPDALAQDVSGPDQREEPREEEGVQGSSATVSGPSPTGKSAAGRGRVVYVSVSLTPRQADVAETWAAAARCSVPFLIRRVAQGLREELFHEWDARGLPHTEESRGARGRHPTSVTLTLRPELATTLSARHDPHDILGLARVIGPAFRAHFETAFDDALAKAIPQPGSEGDAN